MITETVQATVQLKTNDYYLYHLRVKSRRYVVMIMKWLAGTLTYCFCTTGPGKHHRTYNLCARNTKYISVALLLLKNIKSSIYELERWKAAVQYPLILLKISDCVQRIVFN